MSKTHQKHADLARPDLGFFGRNEWAILGTTCDKIKQLAFQLTEALSPKWKIAYVDADHKGADEETAHGRDAKTALAHGAALEFTDKITFHRFDFEEKMDSYRYRSLFNEMDAVLVNGNHFQARQQVVVVDPKKEDSLRRKLDRLTDVHFILLTEGVEEVPAFLQEHLAKTGQSIEEMLVVRFTDFQRIKAHFLLRISMAAPPLNGLVLAGGKSLRMGTDKSSMNYHGKPQRDYLLDLLQNFCEKTWLSVRPGQAVEGDAPLLEDTFLGLGPMGAILSAFRAQPDSAWLVVACDLPLLDEAALEFLVLNRNSSAVATAFQSPENEFPEPLIAIWEPKSYPVLLRFLAQGYSCPRKVLINSNTHLLQAPDPLALQNVNTPEEHRAILEKLIPANS
ncbi:MAG: NTP transferase domain-containing protein [Bacteroidota bacterium]